MFLTSLTLAAFSAVGGLNNVAQSKKIEALTSEVSQLVVNTAENVVDFDEEDENRLSYNEQNELLAYRLMRITKELGILNEEAMNSLESEVTNDETIVDFADQSGYDLPFELFDVQDVEVEEHSYFEDEANNFLDIDNLVFNPFRDDVQHVWANDYSIKNSINVMNLEALNSKIEAKSSFLSSEKSLSAISAATVMDNYSGISSFATNNYGGTGSIRIEKGPVGTGSGGSSGSSSGSSTSNTSQTTSSNKTNVSESLPTYAYNENNVNFVLNGKYGKYAFVGIKVSKDACISLYNFFVTVCPKTLGLNTFATIVSAFKYYSVALLACATTTAFAATLASFVAKVATILKTVWVSILSLLYLLGPIGVIISYIVKIAGLACITVIVTMIICGSTQKGFIAGFVIYHWWDWRFISTTL